jgi:4-amino-4-deoxy-L-arabinose transferase-like glycosyltransferase
MIKSQSTLEYKQGLKQPIIVGVVTVLCLSLFVNKAFHLDDPLFIWTAKQINSHPADFYGFDLNWYGYVSRMSEVSQNPPLSCYYIAIVGAIFGYSEVVLHIAFLLPAAAVAIGTFFLAKRFCANPALAVFVGVLTPGFLVSSTNIMCDTMMLAFWVWAIYYWLTGIEQNKKKNLFLSAILITLSALTKYFAISLLPLLFVYTIFKKRGIGIWVLFFVIPILILAGYQWYTFAMYGRGLISNAAQYAIRVNPSIGLGWFARATSTGIYFTGGCIISVLFFLPFLKSKRISMAFAILLVLFMLMPFLLNLTLNHLKDDPVVKIGFMIQAGLRRPWTTSGPRA